MNKNLKKLAAAGMMTAMIFVVTLLVKIPAPSGYIHPGDALLYIGAMLLGSPWALIAGALGEGLADIAGGYAAYVPATVLIKLLMAVPFTVIRNKADKLCSFRAVLMTVIAGAVNVGGYFAADCLIDKAYAVVDLPGNAIQSVASVVLFILLALALDKAKIFDRFRR